MKNYSTLYLFSPSTPNLSSRFRRPLAPTAFESNFSIHNDTALLRRADAEEFDTPLAYLSEDSRTDIRTTWKAHRAKIEENLQPLNTALGHPLFASNGNIWNEPAGTVAARFGLPGESNTPFTSSYHLCMIIGYNETTNELAVSDSWGKNYAIRWIHVDEAEDVSNRSGFVIDL